jgi:acetylornithine/N-succinyldiaminopimelate aminotransferase
MAVANSVLDVLEEDGFMRHVQQISAYLLSRLTEIAGTYPKLINEIKGLGLLRGIGLNERLPAAELSAMLRAKMVLTVPAGLNTLRILPPLIITHSEVDILCDALSACLLEVSTQK